MRRSNGIKRIVQRVMTTIFTLLEVLGLPPVPRGKQGGKGEDGK